MKEELPFPRLVPFPSRTNRHPQARRPVNDQWKARQAVATKGGFDPAKAVAGACETPAAVEASFAAAVWGPDGEVVPGDSAIIVQFLGVSRG